MSGFYIVFRVFLEDSLIERNDEDLFVPLTITKKDSIKDFLLSSNFTNEKYVESIDLKDKFSVSVKLIEKGTIFSKFYDAESLPSDENLIKDLNLFLNFYKNTLNNYKDDTEISVEEWITVLKDETVINDKMFNILKILYSFNNHAGFTKEISDRMEELGFGPNQNYASQFVGNGRRVQEKLKKRPVINLNSRQDPNYITRFFYRHKIDQGGGEKREKFQLKDELVEALERINLTRDDEYNNLDNFYNEEEHGEDVMSDEDKFQSFYDYLLYNEYFFDNETIENYLLSLKAKPFAILTGNSGTGKTKLSQLFAKYLAEIEKDTFEENQFLDSEDEYITVHAKTNMSSWKNSGWTLPREDFYNILPFEEIEGKYDVEVDGIKAKCTLELLTQLYYDNDDLKDYFKKLYDQDKNGFAPLKIKKDDLKDIISDDYIKESVVNIEKTSGKSAYKENQWFLPKEFFEYLPLPFGYVPCNILVNGIHSTAKFRIMSRIRFEKNHALQDYLRKNDGKKVNLKLKMDPIDLDGFRSKWKTDKKQTVPDEKNVDVLDNYKIIPVGANWTENRNIVGYYNVITNKYQSTPAYELITQAQKHLDEPHFLILDEMNLSHVERYFADFLSAIESGEKIPLYGNEDLEIPSNLFIIGTVNVDETTYMFSPKVLDRANVLEFKTYSAASYMNGDIKLSGPDGNISYLENPLDGNDIRSKGIDELRELFDGVKVENEPFWNILSSEIEKFQSVLKVSGFDFGFRVINEIVRFMAVAWEYENKPDEFSNWERYFDAQIKQKILPKLHGSEKIIGDTIDDLHKICLDSSIDDEAMAKYPESYKKLTEMRKVLRKQRYVSFIN